MVGWSDGRKKGSRELREVVVRIDYKYRSACDESVVKDLCVGVKMYCWKGVEL